MDYKECLENNKAILMEGAVGESLKAEYNMYPDKQVVLVSHIYRDETRLALKNI